MSEAAGRALSDDEALALFAAPGRASRLLVAVSGGPDSVALLGLLAASGRFELHAATVDHGLRPGSAAEAAGVAAFCNRLGIRHAILPWTGEKPGHGLQSAARTARYRLLADFAGTLGAPAPVLITAHTIDDQAETILMRMAHGSGPAGLAGMRPVTVTEGFRHWRPLLGIAKADLVATARSRGWPFVEDPSNRDARFERVRWRTLAPVLAEAGLDAGRLARLGERMARAEAALAAQAAAVFAAARQPAGEGETLLDFAALCRMPEEIVLRVLALSLAEEGARQRLARLERAAARLGEAAAEGRAFRLTLSGRVLSLRPDGLLRIAAERPRRRGVHLG